MMLGRIDISEQDPYLHTMSCYMSTQEGKALAAGAAPDLGEISAWLRVHKTPHDRVRCMLCSLSPLWLGSESDPGLISTQTTQYHSRCVYLTSMTWHDASSRSLCCRERNMILRFWCYGCHSSKVRVTAPLTHPTAQRPVWALHLARPLNC